MDSCVLIGFNYSSRFNDKLRTFLRGIIVDLYICYKYVKDLIDITKITIITDVTINYSISDLKNLIIDSSIDQGILNFVNEIISNKVLHLYTNKEDLMEIIKSKFSNKKNILFYYTGHSHDSEILLPSLNDYFCYEYQDNNELSINLSEIRELLCDHTDQRSEIFMILDCCNSNGLSLPYKLADGVYRLNYDTLRQPLQLRFNLSGRGRGDSDMSEPLSKLKFPLQKIICFSSSSIDESSIILNSGSIFTYTLFKNIKSHRNITELISLISTECLKKFEQNANVCSSYPNLKLIWRWLTINDGIKIEINHLKNFFVKKE